MSQKNETEEEARTTRDIYGLLWDADWRNAPWPRREPDYDLLYYVRPHAFIRDPYRSTLGLRNHIHLRD